MTFLNFELIFFDYVVLILTAVIVIFSFWKGFINSILGLLTWVGSVFVTIYIYQYLSDFLSEQLLNINFLQRFEQFVSVISIICLLYTSPSPRDLSTSRMPSSA